MNELEAIVQRMIDAGESEANIAAVIQEYNKTSTEEAGKIQPQVTGAPVEETTAPDMESNLEPGSSELLGSQEQKGFFQNTFGDSYFFNVLDDLTSSFYSGYKTAQSFDEVQDVMSELGNISDEKLDAYVKAVQESQSIGMTDEEQEWNTIFDLETSKGTNGLLAGLIASAKNPLGLLYTGVKSFGQMFSSEALPVIAAGAGVGAGTGAAAGSVVPGIGTAAGALTGTLRGAVGGLSTAVDTFASFNEMLQEELANQGKEFNAEDIRSLFNNEETAKKLRNRAIGRGITIGAVDALTFGIAGKAGGKAAELAVKTGRTGTKLAALGAQQAVESAGGALGEVSGRVVAGQEMDSKEIFLEAFAGTGVLTQSPKALSNAVNTSRKAQYIVNGKEVTRDQVADFIFSAEPQDIAGADIKMKNDAALFDIAKRKQKKAFSGLNEEQKVEAAKKREEVAKQEATEKVEKSVNFMSGIASALNIPFEVYETQDQYYAATGTARLYLDKKTDKELTLEEIQKLAEEKNQTTEEFLNSNKNLVEKVKGGNFDSTQGKIFINKEGAIETMQLNIGAHEILHPILNALVGSKTINKNLTGDELTRKKIEAQRSLVEDFRKKLTRSERRKMDSILAGKKIKLDSDEYFTEYFNVFSDSVVKDQIKGDKNLLNRIGDYLKKLFGMYDIELGFDNTDQIFNFMQEYNKAAKSGVVSEKISQVLDAKKAGITQESIKLGKMDQPSQEALNKRVNDLVGPKNEAGKYTVTKQQYDRQGYVKAYQAIVEGDMITPLIRRGIEGDAVYGIPIENFIEDVKMELADVLYRFNPEDNDSLIGFINSQLRFRKQDVMNRYAQEAGTTSIDIEEGETGAMREIEDIDAGDEFAAFEEEVITFSPKVQQEFEESRKIDPRDFLDFPDQIEVDSDIAKSLKMKPEEVEAFNNFDLEEAVAGVDLTEITLANTPRLYDYAVAISMGINPKKIFDTGITLTSSEFKSAQQFLYKNAQQFLDILPEGSTDKASGKAADKFLNKGMNIPNNILRAFYTKQDRLSGDAAGLYPFKLRDDISVKDFLEAFGMDEDGNMLPGVNQRSSEAQTVKAAATVLSKLATNSHFVSLVEKTDSDPMILVNLSEGKSENQYSTDIKTSNVESKSFDKSIKGLSSTFKNTFKLLTGHSIEDLYEVARAASNPNGNQVIELEKVEELVYAARYVIQALPKEFLKSNKSVVMSMLGFHHRENGYTNFDTTAFDSWWLRPDTKKFYAYKNEKGETVEITAKSTKAERAKINNTLYSQEKYDKDAVATKNILSKGLVQELKQFAKEHKSINANGSGKKTLGREVNNDRLVEAGLLMNKVYKEIFNVDKMQSISDQKLKRSLGVLLLQTVKGTANITEGFRAISKVNTKFDGLLSMFGTTGIQIEHLNSNIDTMMRFMRSVLSQDPNHFYNVPEVAMLPKVISKLLDSKNVGLKTAPKKDKVAYLNSLLKMSEEEIQALIDQNVDKKEASQYSFDTKQDLNWDVFENDDSYQAFASFKNRGVDYEIALTKNRTFDYDPFEGTYGIAEGTIENDKKSVTLSFSENIEDEDGDTQMIYDVTGRGKRGDVNPYEVFSIVANGTLDIIKKDKLNSITFTAKEDNRARLYEVMARRFAKELGWDIYNFQNISEFGEGSTVFLVYNSEEIFKNSDVRQDELRDIVQFSSEINDPEARMAAILSNMDRRYTAGQTLDRATAKNLAATRAKRRDILAPSADDFVGLLYRFLDKGKLGEDQYKFFEDNLIKPFAAAYQALNAKRQKVTRSYKNINKQNPEVVKKLKQDSGFGGFTFEQALRVWLFQKAGFTPNGLNEDTQKALVQIVKNNPDLEAYGQELSGVLGIDQFWVEPDAKNWQIDSIKSDMVDAVEKVSRKAMLEQWIANKDAIFSSDNMNKIEATYGPDFRAALEDMLYRMENGTARPEGTNKQMNQFLNWIRGSVAVTMFFNTRSAILQQISLVNFINWSDNNPIKAAAAVANISQYAKDWAFIFNSDYLKERRGGLKTDVNAADLAEALKKGGVKGMHARLLQLGFSFTQIGDSVAIATGGAPFLRNRINTYLSQGMDQQAAEQQAFLDFQEISEESQQSARPDRLAKQQTDVIGRVFLAFQNTPMQYTRIIVKAAKDLAAGRGDMKTNISKIAYYMVVQNIIFSAMQQAMFGMLFEDDEEENKEDNEKKKLRLINNVVDTVVRGTGLYGGVLATAKNVILKFAEQEAKQEEGRGRADHAYTLIEAMNISPAIGIKGRQMYSSIQNYRYNKDRMADMGVTIDNPALDIVGSASAFTLNVPLDRALTKVRNLKAASDAETETWAKIALVLGWNTWNVGIDRADSKKKVGKGKKKSSFEGMSLEEYKKYMKNK